jgi:hypothetical protein
LRSRILVAVAVAWIASAAPAAAAPARVCDNESIGGQTIEGNLTVEGAECNLSGTHVSGVVSVKKGAVLWAGSIVVGELKGEPGSIVYGENATARRIIDDLGSMHLEGKLNAELVFKESRLDLNGDEICTNGVGNVKMIGGEFEMECGSIGGNLVLRGAEANINAEDEETLHVHGNVLSTGGQARINRIIATGNITVDHASLVVLVDDEARNVTVRNNSATEQRHMVVAGNTAAERLTCFQNAPAPTDEVHINRVGEGVLPNSAAKLAGQCSGL